MNADKDYQEELDSVRDTTRDLIDSIERDEWPRDGAIADFGLDTQWHYESLYYGVRSREIRPRDLDKALGRGDKLTALTRGAKSNPHKDIEFYTAWDGLYGRRRAIDQSKEKSLSQMSKEQEREIEADREWERD